VERTFRHHSYLFAMAKKLPRVSFGIIFLCWLPPLVWYLAVYREFSLPIIRLSIVSSLTVTFIALLAAMVLHELCNTVYTVSESSFIKKSPYKIKIAHFDRVIRFRFVRIPFFNGYGAIVVPGGVIRLPFIIDHLAECVEAIKQRLDMQERAGLYDEKNLLAFQKKALVHEKSVRRIQKAAGPLFQTAISWMAGGAFIAQAFWDLPLRWIVCWGIMGIVFPTAGFLVAEGLLYRKTARSIAAHDRASLPIHDGENDAAIDASKTYWTIGAITAFVYLVAGIVFKKIIAIL